MFSSSSGNSKGKRRSRSFFSWGNSGTSSSSDGQSTTSATTTLANSNSNSGSSYAPNSKHSIRPSNSRSSMRSTNNKNAFMPSDRPISRGKSLSSMSGKRTVSSPQESSPVTEVKNKHSSSRLSSNDKSRVSSSTSHRSTPSSHTSSQVSSHPRKPTASSSERQKSSVSSSPRKDVNREISLSSSSLKPELGDPLALSSSSSNQKPGRVRRPPPPVDLSFLKHSVKKAPEDGEPEVKQRHKPDPLPLSQELPDECLGALNYMEKNQPQHNRDEQVLKRKDEVQDTRDVPNPRQHKKQSSEAEKFEAELDYFIKENSAIEDSPTSQFGKSSKKEVNHEIDFRNDLNASLTASKGLNNEDFSSYIDPLKIPEVSQRNAASASSKVASPRVLTPLETAIAQSEPLLQPPPPLPPKEPLEPSETVSSSPQQSAPDSGTKFKGLTEIEKRNSGTSATVDERTDRISFSDSSASNSSKGVRPVRGSSPIANNLIRPDSVDSTSYPNNNNNNRMCYVHTNGLDRPPLNNSFQPHGHPNYDMDYQVEADAPKDPFLDPTELEQMDESESKKADSEEYSSDENFDESSAMYSVKTEEAPVPRRKFRVVNEDRPTFHMSESDESLAKDNYDFDDTASHYSMQSHESTYSQVDSITPSEKSSTFVPMNFSNQSLDRKTTSSGIRSGFVSLDSDHEKEIGKSIGSFSKTKDNFVTPGTLSNHQSTRSNRSNNSSTTVSSGSPWPDKSIRLVSSYVEELRLKYYRASNFLQAPPNLPVTLKQKNNLVQPKNVKVKIRTNTKQIGIKHGRAKQKLLTLDTTDEAANDAGAMHTSNNTNKINVDHTREFHNLLNNKSSPAKSTSSQGRNPSKSKGEDALDDYLYTIPGDDAYDSDDAMAPLREGEENDNSGITRSNTVKSYFTKQQEKLHHINETSQYEKLPSNINIQDYLDKDPISKTLSGQSGDSGINEPFSYGYGLRVTNPDDSSE